MKVLLGLASVVVLSVAPAFAGDGQVSHQALAKMGLSGMKAMADSQGAQIRGMSVIVGGGSYAYINGVGGSAGSVNFYGATGAKSASGDNASVAGDTTSTITTVGFLVTTKTTVNVIGAGGFSSATSSNR
jgi:hypothetical protein